MLPVLHRIAWTAGLVCLSCLGLPGVVSALHSDSSSLYLASNTSIGTIVKQFPQLDGLTLLPSQSADSFYLLNSGHLMLADSLYNKAGNYIITSG